jgi:thermolabile hemolysin
LAIRRGGATTAPITQSRSAIGYYSAPRSAAPSAIDSRLLNSFFLFFKKSRLKRPSETYFIGDVVSRCRTLPKKMKMFSLLRFFFIVGSLLASLTGARGTQLVVFGDSLSDNGNTFAALGIPQPPYFEGRFTNGPNWVDYFTGLAGLPPATAFLEDGGTNFAVGGSTSPFLSAQITTYLAANGGHANRDDLYVVWIGANDFQSGIQPSITLRSIQSGLALLGAAGAKNVILVNVPDISLTPDVIAEGGATVQAAKQFVATIDTDLQVRIPLEALLLGLQLTYVDINRVFTQVVEHPFLFGFFNSTGEAFDPDTGVVQPNPNSYVFWDGFHPTTRGHYIAAWTIFQTNVRGRKLGAGSLKPAALSAP